MFQAAVDLPDAGPDAAADAAAARSAATPALQWADAAWAVVLDRLVGARATKADTSVDLRSATDDLVADVCAALPLPSWPAAGPALLRLVGALAGGRG